MMRISLSNADAVLTEAFVKRDTSARLVRRSEGPARRLPFSTGHAIDARLREVRWLFAGTLRPAGRQPGRVPSQTRLAAR
jgi:hypothetical protein